METTRGLETLPFIEAIRKEEERARTALPLQDRVHSYVDRGRYSAQIRRLWRWFGKNNVLILKQEELSANPQTTMNKICEFLLIDSCEIGAKITSNQGVQENHLKQRYTTN